MKHKISIIIPAYNIRDYISRCISSVLAQSYTDLQVIVVDDGSTDGTGELLDRLENTDPRLRVIHQGNGGVTSARLHGLREATGEYIGFVDGDDEIEPDMYAHLLENAETYDADISHCGYRMVFPKHVNYYYNTRVLQVQDRPTALKDLLEGSFIEPGLCNKLFRRILFENLISKGLMDLSIRYDEDLLMNFYLFREAKSAVYEDFCPYHYIVHTGSACNGVPNEYKLKDPLRVLHIIEQEMTDEPEVVRRALQVRMTRVLVSVAAMPQKEQPGYVSDYCQQVRRELHGRLPQIMHSGIGAADKCKAFWAGIWPASYRWVHDAYARFTGIDKIYDVSE